MNGNVGSQHLLVDVVQDLSLARSVARVAEIVRSAARALARADGATFVLRDGDRCHYLDEDAIAPLWKGLRFPIEACVSGWAMIRGEPVTIPDITKDSRVPIAAYRPTFVKSLFMTPIRRVDSIGAIGVYWAVVHEPTTDEKQALEALANATCVAMQNIGLNADLERKIAELERASEIKDQFLLSLSHELRTPMNSILGWSAILRDEVPDLQPELREGIESIHRNAQTELRLIGDLLDTSQFLVGRMGLHRERMQLEDVVRSAVQSVRVACAKKGVRLTLVDDSGGAPMEGDPDRLLQVVGNLLSNALKFTPAGGEIRVELRDDGQHYVVGVQDDGEGIEVQLLPKVFDRFQSQSGQLNRMHGGLGLGLAIVKSLVEGHGGTVEASSRGLGHGSRFEVRLPHPVSVQSLGRRISLAGRRPHVTNRSDDATGSVERPVTLDSIV